MPSLPFPCTLTPTSFLPLPGRIRTHVSGQLTRTVLPQGFRDSPHIFGQALAADLQQCALKASTLLQYVDDLLLCTPSLSLSQEDTSTLLNFLGAKGYQGTPSKAQLCTPSVTYLGIFLTPTSKSLTGDCIRLLKPRMRYFPFSDL